MKESAVIPSRADGEEPLNCKLRHLMIGGVHRRCEVRRFVRDDMLRRASIIPLPQT